MSTQADVVGRIWLDAPATRRASDIALGALVLAAAVVAFTSGPGTAVLRRPAPAEWVFLTVVAGLLAIAGLVLIVRGSLFTSRAPVRWRPMSLLIVATTLGAATLAVRQWVDGMALLFGPADFAAQIVFQLSLGIGLARLSHVRAVAMVLLGLLLSTVGVDVSSGAERLTMGLEQLSDGIAFSSLVLGLMVVADSAICVVSPTLLLETYAVRLAGWAAPRVPVVAGILMRAAAVLAIAAACYAVFALNRSLWDVGQLAVFGAVGIACKLLGWNRPLIFLSFLLGHLLEENISRALLISRGDPATFARPLSAAFLLLACLVVVAAAVLSARARAREPIL